LCEKLLDDYSQLNARRGERKAIPELKSSIKERAGVGESNTTGNGYDVKGSRDEQLESLTFSEPFAGDKANIYEARG
jgi:hypothetical protein